MKHIHSRYVVAALLLALISTDALAAAPAPKPTSQQPITSATYFIADAGTPNAHKVYYFNRLDRNHDGQLSRSEIPRDMVMLRTRFIYADFNGNGKLSPAEYIMWKEHTAPEYIGVYHALVFVYGNPADTYSHIIR
ncbi:MAG TPA: hypothetical protein VF271_03975 [Rhodanobacteraceae bacterium]